MLELRQRPADSAITAASAARSGISSASSSSSKTRSADAMVNWMTLAMSGELGDRLGELLGILDERLDVADARSLPRDHDAADHGDQDVAEIADRVSSAA